jgi:hypothetical protein
MPARAKSRTTTMMIINPAAIVLVFDPSSLLPIFAIGKNYWLILIKMKSHAKAVYSIEPCVLRRTMVETNPKPAIFGVDL